MHTFDLEEIEEGTSDIQRLVISRRPVRGAERRPLAVGAAA